MKLTNRTFTGQVPKLTKWLYTSSGMFRDGLYQFISLFLMTFVQFCGLGDTTFEEYLAMYGVITAVVIVLRIWDGINDPLMGFLIEKCHFKTGKYRPWIFLGALSNSIVSIMMFWVMPTGWAYVAFFCVFYFLWDFTFTMNDIAFWSVLPNLTNEEKVRNNITTILSIFISIGTFAVGGIVPLVSAGNQELTYKITALVCSILFLGSQMLLVIFMKERQIPQSLEKNSESMKFKDIFTVVIKNDQIRYSIIAILFYYLGSSILVAAGLNYFYFNFGYKEGGTYQLYFTIVYAAATIIGQAVYPLLVNKLKWKRKRILEISYIVSMCAYIFLFCYVFMPDYKALFPLLCVFAFFAFFGQTIVSLIIYIMIQDSIDYNEYKFNERRESAIFSLRAFTAKIASSLQQLVLYIFLSASSLLAISNGIANLEKEYVNQTEFIQNEATKLTDSIELWQRIVFQVGFTLIPFICFLISYLIIKFKYNITEESHQQMIDELNKRHEREIEHE